MNAPNESPSLSRTEVLRPGSFALFAVLVFVATWVGNELARINFPATGAAIVFVPYAVLTTALMLSAPSHWWIYIAASSLGHLMPSWVGTASFSIAFAASTQVANVL